MVSLIFVINQITLLKPAFFYHPWRVASFHPFWVIHYSFNFDNILYAGVTMEKRTMAKQTESSAGSDKHKETQYGNAKSTSHCPDCDYNAGVDGIDSDDNILADVGGIKIY
jgi:hypothetical protein